MSALDDDRDPLLSPPSTNLDTGNWDADGPLAGWRVDRDGDSHVLDYVIESTWERKGCFCLLTRVTEYIVLGRHHGPERIGESETYYRGYVHAPGVESLPKGCYGTTIVQCENQGGWFVWDERAFFNGYSHTKTVSEVAHRKTERLADAAAQRRKGSYERRERLDAVPPTPARPYRTAQRRARSRRRSRPPDEPRLRALWRPGRTPCAR